MFFLGALARVNGFFMPSPAQRNSCAIIRIQRTWNSFVFCFVFPCFQVFFAFAFLLLFTYFRTFSKFSPSFLQVFSRTSSPPGDHDIPWPLGTSTRLSCDVGRGSSGSRPYESQRRRVHKKPKLFEIRSYQSLAATSCQLNFSQRWRRCSFQSWMTWVLSRS